MRTTVHPGSLTSFSLPCSYSALTARIVALATLALLAFWISAYLDGVSLTPRKLQDGSNDTGQLFNLHPVLMFVAFGLFMTEALLSYKAPLVPWLARAARKQLHAGLHVTSGVAIVLGLISVFKSHSLKLPTPIPDLYSPHSFLGSTTIALWAIQLLIGLGSYIWPKLPLAQRVALGPVHRASGLSIWVLGLCTMATGIQEKTNFVIAGKALAGHVLHSSIVRIPAALVLLLALLGLVMCSLHVPLARPVMVDASGDVVEDGYKVGEGESGPPVVWQAIPTRNSL